MFHQLVSHNDDLNRLVKKGYAVAFDSSCLIIRDIPYLDSDGKLQIGAIVTVLEFANENQVRQKDHQIFFTGSHPHTVDKKPIPNLGGGNTQYQLSEACKDVVVQRSFSNKPFKDGQFHNFPDFYEKIESYVRIISGPAIEVHNVNPLTFRSVEETASDPIFKIHDTLTSRAGIKDIASSFENDIVAVIGLGGTGSYLLDFLVKTRIKEIRAFDLDLFYIHNVFRSPGTFAESEFKTPKAEVYRKRYENLRNGLSFTPKLIDATCEEDLNGVTFAFVCVDKGSSRAGIFDILISKGIPFIDVGMGLSKKQGPLSGMLRVTYYSPEDGKKLRDMGLSELTDTEDDLYRTNIQIGELNALNACLAVIKFKQLRGFYVEDDPYYHILFNISDLTIKGISTNNED